MGKWYKLGVSDILGIYKGKFLAIEVKTPTTIDEDGDKRYGGRLTENQKIFLQEIQEQGGIAIIARSVEDVEQALKKQEEAIS